MPTLPEPDSVRGIATAVHASTREILGRVTSLIQTFGYDAVISEDDPERPANAILHERYAEMLRGAYDQDPAELTARAVQAAKEDSR